jgi:NDP-sugar pyrophosphorylase family protein
VRAVILAGGKGTRLAPYTAILPKPLMPVGDRPILEVILRQLAYCGIRDVVISVGYLGGLIEAYFQDGHGRVDGKGLRLTYAREPKALGTAGPLASIPGLDDTFLVMNGDILTNLDLDALVGFHKKSGAALTIAAHRKEVGIDLGVLETDGAGLLVAYREKPAYSFDVSMGIYVYEPRVLGHIQAGKSLDFPDLVGRLLEAGEKVATFRSESSWFDIGRREDYERARAAFGDKSFDL